MKQDLPDWVKTLLHELYSPLGKRRMEDAFRPFTRAMQQATEAMRRFEKTEKGEE